MIAEIFSTIIFVSSYILGSYLDLRDGEIYDLLPILSSLLVTLLWTGTLTNALILTGIGLTLWHFRYMGFADIEYLYLSGAYLYFLHPITLLLGMTTTTYIYMEHKTRKKEKEIKLIPILLIGTTISYLLYLLV